MNKKKLREYLEGDYNLMCLRKCVSTNTLAKDMAARGELHMPAVITADDQTGGRGRYGRSFISIGVKGAYFTFAFCLPTAQLDGLLLTPTAAVAVHRAVFALYRIDCKIKWVNDLYLGGKKLCGILTEVVRAGDEAVVVVGIGLNLRYDRRLEGAPNAGALDMFSDAVSTRERVIAEIINNFFKLLGSDVIAEYAEKSLLLNKDIEYVKDGERHEARAQAIDEKGRLVVRTRTGTDVLDGNDISVKLLSE